MLRYGCLFAVLRRCCSLAATTDNTAATANDDGTATHDGCCSGRHLCRSHFRLFAFLAYAGSPYLNWNYSDPETAVAGTALHAFEFVFVRIAPFALAGMIAGAVLTRKRK